MLFSYVDEAYDKQRYRLVAVVVDVERLNASQDTIRSILERANSGPALSAAEFHAHDLFHGRGLWIGHPPRQRINLYHQVLKGIAAHSPRIVVVGFDRDPEPTNNWPPEAHAALMQRLIVHLDAAAAALGSHVLVVADDHHAHAGLRDGLRVLQSGLGSRVVDTLHFVPSHVAPLVQAADLVGFLLRRIPVERDERAQRANAVLLGAIEHLIEVTDITVWRS